MGVEYKFVELSTVTDETIEEAVNAWVGRGWQLEGIRFVTTEASRRPSMAFISFTREVTKETKEQDAADAQAAAHPKGPRLVKVDPDDEQG